MRVVVAGLVDLDAGREASLAEVREACARLRREELTSGAESLAINMDLGPKAIYAADFGSENAIKPMIDVSIAIYLIGSELPGTMSARSKMAFAELAILERALAAHGGERGDFDAALLAAYHDKVEDTIRIRQRRAERRARAQHHAPDHQHTPHHRGGASVGEKQRRLLA